MRYSRPHSPVRCAPTHRPAVLPTSPHTRPLCSSPCPRAAADPYPYLLVNIGSGVSIVRVDGEGSYQRVSGESSCPRRCRLAILPATGRGLLAPAAAHSA